MKNNREFASLRLDAFVGNGLVITRVLAKPNLKELALPPRTVPDRKMPATVTVRSGSNSKIDAFSAYTKQLVESRFYVLFRNVLEAVGRNNDINGIVILLER